MLALSLSVAYTPVSAQESGFDSYADFVVSDTSSFLGSDSALGAPDNRYADDINGGGTLTLDMGEGEEGLGDLTVYYAILDVQAQITFKLFDSENNELLSYGGPAPLDNTWVIPYDGETPYRYVSIWNSGTKTIRIDAIESEFLVDNNENVIEVDNETGETLEVVEEGSVEEPEIINANPLNGSLIKLTDDWNDETTRDTTIYMLDADNVRHIIPNEKVFESWGLSFDDVTIIGEGTLKSTPLGKNVYVRPGSYLIKIQLTPEVYAVEPGGVLRWIQNEEIAEELYGSEWNKRVIDVPETLFSQYTSEGALTEATYTKGSFVKVDSGAIFYIDSDGNRLSLGPITEEAMDLSDKFMTTGMSSGILAEKHEYVGRMVYSDEIRWPF